MIPRATYRLQFHRDFTFADAAQLVPYLAELGVSDLYASPILTARPGSVHGYDVIDPTRVNPELGGEEGLRTLVAALRRHGLGLVVDIVPNHMYAGNGNRWWLDVLRHGASSRYASYFDIDWLALDGKILLPILGKPLDEVLAANDLTRDGETLRYFDHELPLAPASTGVADLPALLARQHYRLAWWRLAAEQINWRRFFDINDLVAMRVEDRDVFEATHATLIRLYADGLIDGFRIDHIDGLADPSGYCRRLRALLTDVARERSHAAPVRQPYIVVEKILGRDEQLPGHWETDGTTGYDFMNEVSAVLHDPAGEAPLTRLWTTVSGRPACFEDEERPARREILERRFAAPLDTLTKGLTAHIECDSSAIRRCLIALLAHFDVYRTYPDTTENNREFLDRALGASRRTVAPGDRAILDRIGQSLHGPSRCQARFQQLSAPLAAKAVEDTAFYRYGRLLSRNDVGFDAARFSMSVENFHDAMQRRRTHFPKAMLATATHDHKRGEDVRARLAVLSEIPDEWSAAVASCLAANARFRQSIDGEAAPDPGDEYMLYQTIVGAWPTELTLNDPTGLDAYARRLADWQRKAAREAKLATDWIAPNAAYEEAAHQFLMRLFADSNEGLHALAAFASRIGPAGAVNGLVQLLLKLTVPGTPDLYQGTELWDLSLVDPDNRRPVDYARRRATLAPHPDPSQYVPTWRDGRIKQTAIARILQLRREMPSLFAEGDYLPLAATGPAAGHVVAFLRRRGDAAAIVVGARSVARLLESNDRPLITPERWGDTQLVLPRDLAGRDFRSVLATRRVRASASTPIAALLNGLPVAIAVTGTK